MDALDRAISAAVAEEAAMNLSPRSSAADGRLTADQKSRLAFADNASRSFLLQNKRIQDLNRQLMRQQERNHSQNLMISSLQRQVQDAAMAPGSRSRRAAQHDGGARMEWRPGAASCQTIGISIADTVPVLPAPPTPRRPLSARLASARPGAHLLEGIAPADGPAPSPVRQSQPSGLNNQKPWHPVNGRPAPSGASDVRPVVARTPVGQPPTPSHRAAPKAKEPRVLTSHRRLEMRARTLISRHPAAFGGGGSSVVFPRIAPPPESEDEVSSEVGDDYHARYASELSAAETMSADATKHSVKAAAAAADLIMLEAAREAAAERADKTNWNEDDQTWTEFDGGQLEHALAVDEELGEAPVRLLDARFIIRLAERSGWLRSRQGLPDEAFIDLPQLRFLKAGHTGLRIVCVSHMWLQPDHPDPRRTTLQLLCRALKIMLHEQTGTIAVFMDFCSLFQPSRSNTEEQLFRKALSRQCDLFGHPHCWTFMVTSTPAAYPRGFAFTPGKKPNLAKYTDRGWPYAEYNMSMLIMGHNAGGMVVDLGKLDLAIDKYVEKKLNAMVDEDEQITPLGLGTDLRTMLEEAVPRRPAPLTPAHFTADMQRKSFTSRGSDIGIVCSMYRRVLGRLRTLHGFDYRELKWTDRDAKLLASVMGGGWMTECRRLYLAYNSIGDEGIFAVANALRAGKMRALEVIDIRGNPAKHEARQAVRDALDDLMAQGLMRERNIEMFGSPEQSIRLIQRRMRKRLKQVGLAIAMVNSVVKKDEAPETSEAPVDEPPETSEPPAMVEAPATIEVPVVDETPVVVAPKAQRAEPTFTPPPAEVVDEPAEVVHEPANAADTPHDGDYADTVEEEARSPSPPTQVAVSIEGHYQRESDIRSPSFGGLVPAAAVKLRPHKPTRARSGSSFKRAV